MLRLSRRLLARNFARQNAALVFGVVAFAQAECRCQKHPWTKMTVRILAKTMSGRPGNARPCNR
jgi:hypothetical protein